MMGEGWNATGLPALGDGLLTTWQTIILVIILLAIATAFAAISVEVFGGEE